MTWMIDEEQVQDDVGSIVTTTMKFIDEMGNKEPVYWIS